MLQFLKPLIIVVVFIATGQSIFSQTVIHYKNGDTTLEKRFMWARDEAQTKAFHSRYWVGYSIKRLMQKYSFIGSFYSDARKNKPSLLEILTGKTINLNDIPPTDIYGCSTSGGYSNPGDDKDKPKVMKEIAILIHYDGPIKQNIDEILVSNISLHADLRNDPLLWLGNAEDGESIQTLHTFFNTVKENTLQEEIISAIAMHAPSADVGNFLKNILLTQEKACLREHSVFWMGQQNTDEALGILIQTVEKDISGDVREKAIFAISEMSGDQAINALIDFARKGQNREVRNKAIFWLSQKASSRGVKTIEEIASGDEEEEIQKNAVFALTQLPDNQGITTLIGIAKSHQKPEVRKSAIFWLGQSEDPRAVETLVEIVRQ